MVLTLLITPTTLLYANHDYNIDINAHNINNASVASNANTAHDVDNMLIMFATVVAANHAATNPHASALSVPMLRQVLFTCSGW